LSIRHLAQPLAVFIMLVSFSFFSAAQQAPAPDPSSSASASSSSATAQPTAAGQSNSTNQQPATENDKDKAQDTQKNQANQAQASQQAGDTTSQNKSGTSNDRLFFALPNFLTLENAGQVPPLTAGQKFKVVFRGSFDYVMYPWYGFLAGLSQAENSEPGYGQGAEGYAKRYGAAFADGTIENFMTQAVLPSILHQDPRYFQLGHGSFAHRTFYAVSRNIVTRTDSGHSQFNYSEVLGGAAAAFMSTYSYHPAADQTVANTTKVWGTQFGYDALTLVVKEYWPDIRRKAAAHKHKKDAAQPAAAPSNPANP
jgi:hypothetical protein